MLEFDELCILFLSHRKLRKLPFLSSVVFFLPILSIVHQQLSIVCQQREIERALRHHHRFPGGDRIRTQEDPEQVTWGRDTRKIPQARVTFRCAIRSDVTATCYRLRTKSSKNENFFICAGKRFPAK